MCQYYVHYVIGLLISLDQFEEELLIAIVSSFLIATPQTTRVQLRSHIQSILTMAPLLQFICGFLLYGMLQATDVQQPSEETDSCYPKGSVACKMWNYTNMDCTYRKLLCIPPLHHASIIQSLNLQNNNLSIVSDNVFHNLVELRHLDLENSFVSTLQDSAFNGLHQLVSLDLSLNSISYIQEDIFKGLTKLQDLDISNNVLSYIHENAFSTNTNLLSLDLKDNQISVISESTFHSQSRLTSLNLLGNCLVSLYSFPFHGLMSLQRLQLTQNMSSLSVTSFSGLENLQHLRLSFVDGSYNVTGTPLALLSSLTELTIYGVLSNCDTISKLFIGLHNLQQLDIRVGGSCPDIIFCSSYEEYPYECTRVIPLKSLIFSRDSTNPTSLPAFNALHNLTSLELYKVNISEAAKALISLDSPLQELFIRSTTMGTTQSINSTTFALWGSWKTSLQILSLYTVSVILLEDSPFQWFTDLKQLSISTSFLQSSTLTLSVDTFIGLKSLQKLYLRGIDVHTSSLIGALSIFSSYNSLTILDLSGNQLSGNFEALWEQLCNISSLEKVENDFDISFHTFWPCSPTNLKELSIGYQTNNMGFSGTVCEVASQLVSLDASHPTWSLIAFAQIS